MRSAVCYSLVTDFDLCIFHCTSAEWWLREARGTTEISATGETGQVNGCRMCQLNGCRMSAEWL